MEAVLQKTVPRPDLAIHDYVVRLPFPVVVKALSDILGRKLTAYIADVTDVRTVDDWISNKHEARPAIRPRCTFALEIAQLIADHDDPSVAQAWFQGLNPQLADRSAARLLREGNLDEVGPDIRAAALAFLVGG